MSLATLLTPPNVSDTGWLNEFAFANMDEHRKIAMATQAKNNIQLTVYPLDPIEPYGFNAWLGLHQQAHNDMANALGIDNFDISDVDFRNQDQMQAWLWLHFSMHQEAAQKLGLT